MLLNVIAVATKDAIIRDRADAVLHPDLSEKLVKEGVSKLHAKNVKREGMKSCKLLRAAG